MNALRFISPNGSLAEQTMKWLRMAGYAVCAPDRRGYCGTSGGIEFYQLDRRMVPRFLEAGAFDAGITGLDLYFDSGITQLRILAELQYARASNGPTYWVLARPKGWTDSGRCVRIACELPTFAKRVLSTVQLPFSYEIVRIDGSEEACVTQRLADMVLVVTETGNSLKANDLEAVPGCECLLKSRPVMLSRLDLSAAKRAVLEGLKFALQAVVGAVDYVMVTFNLPASVEIPPLGLPSNTAPTVVALNEAWKSVAICMERSSFGDVLAIIVPAGARGIILQEVQGYLS